MDYSQFKNTVIAQAQAMGLAEYELYYQASESTSVDTYKGEINEFTAAADGGVCFRCIVNGKMGYASTEALTQAQAVSIVERAVSNARSLEAEEQVFLGEGGKTYAQLHITPYPLPTTEQLVSKALAAQQKLYEASEAVIDGASAEAIAQRSEIGIYNSKGLDLHYENNMAGLVAVAVVARDGEMSNDFKLRLGAMDTLDEAALAKEAVQGALEKLGGEPAPTGVQPVVFSPKAMSDLLSTYSSVFSSAAAQKGLSKLADREGEVIAAETVTIVDDPFYPENPMPIHFDAEGSPTVCKKVVEKGVLNTLLYNLKTAAVAGKQTTGNAAKTSYSAAVAVRPFTFYLAAGEYTEGELLEKAQNGVYIQSLSGLHAGANPVTGDFSLQSAGYLIENGKKTTRVKSFTVAGNFYELLKNITAVGKDLTLPWATGMNAYGAPTVLVEKLSIAGK